MRRREKILVLVLALVALVYLGRGPLVGIFWSSIQQKTIAADELRKEVAQLERQFERGLAVQRKLRQWKTQSLPADPSVASTLCQKWLLELAGRTGLDQAVVTPNRVVPREDAYHRIPFTIQAETRLDRVRGFLEGLYHTNLLTQVTRLQLEADSPVGNPDLYMTLQVEAIALRDASSGEEPLTDLAQVFMQSAPPSDTAEYEEIVQRNLFVRGYNGPPPPPRKIKPKYIKPKPLPKPRVDTAMHVYLIATFRRADRRELWLYDRLKNKTIELREGDELDVAEIKGRVLAVGDQSVLFLIDGKTLRLQLGKNLRHLRAVDSKTP